MEAQGGLGEGRERQKGQLQARRGLGTPGKSPFSTINPCVTLHSSPLLSGPVSSYVGYPIIG